MEDFRQCVAIEGHEGFEHLGGIDMKPGFVNVGGVVVSNEFRGPFPMERGFFEPIMMSLPIEKAPMTPAAEMVDGDTLSSGAEFLEDLGVGFAIEEHLVELIADFFGKLGDPAAR